jgi:cysteinyl-tRNA synthetase
MSLDEIERRWGTHTLDIHAGGVDLIFPHHEDEIAQSEAATGEPFARCWVHGAFLNVRGTKMSKRFGNILTARDLKEQGVDAAAVRLLVSQTHYRKPLDFTDESLASAVEGVKRLGVFHDRLTRLAREGGKQANEALDSLAQRFEAEFAAALDDDLDAPRAVALLFVFLTDANRELDRAPGAAAAQRALAAVDGAMAVLDVLPTPKTADDALSHWVRERLAEREKARKAKDFGAADRIRQELKARGVEIEDSPAGTKWRLA